MILESGRDRWGLARKDPFTFPSILSIHHSIKISASKTQELVLISGYGPDVSFFHISREHVRIINFVLIDPVNAQLKDYTYHIIPSRYVYVFFVNCFDWFYSMVCSDEDTQPVLYEYIIKEMKKVPLRFYWHKIWKMQLPPCKNFFLWNSFLINAISKLHVINYSSNQQEKRSLRLFIDWYFPNIAALVITLNRSLLRHTAIIQIPIESQSIHLISHYPD